MVVAAGTAGDLVADRVRQAAAARGRSAHVVHTSRNAAAHAGSTWQRLSQSFGADEPIGIVVDGQWCDAESLDEIADAARPVVTVHRPGPMTPALGRLHDAARRRGAVLQLAPQPTGPDDPTGGHADLLHALAVDGSLDAEVTTRLSVVDHDARTAAELLAYGADPAQLGQLLELDGDRHDTTLQALAVEGLLYDARMIAGVAEVVRRVATPGRRTAAITLLAERGDPGTSIDLAALLTGLGERSSAAGAVHTSAAIALAPSDPVRALTHVDHARACGSTDTSLRQCEAVAALATGDARRALAALGDAAGSPDADDELVRAAAWAALGDHRKAHDCLLRSSAPSLAAWSAVATGATTPSVSDDESATGMLAHAIGAWRAGDQTAWNDLAKRASIRARSEADPDRWPVTPDLIATIVTGRLGELAQAAQINANALDDDVGGAPHRRMHLLVGAWLAARRGHLDDAAGTLEQLADAALTPHERLWRAATECAIALRDSEPGGIDPAAAAASAALGAVDVQLFDLDALTDAGAVLARSGARQPDDPFDALATIVGRDGAPVWAAHDLAWARLSVALAQDDLEHTAQRAAELGELGHVTPYAAARCDAAAALTDLVAGRASAASIESLARRLADAGSSHEAARLCGIAALHMTDEADTRRLLKESRTWRAQRTKLRQTARVDRSIIKLSEQEARVAQMVLDGHTHKQIGAALFISAKTVEHHVAHIRTKLAAGNRAELLAAMRDYLAAGNKPS